MLDKTKNLEFNKIFIKSLVHQKPSVVSEISLAILLTNLYTYAALGQVHMMMTS